MHTQKVPTPARPPRSAYLPCPGFALNLSSSPGASDFPLPPHDAMWKLHLAGVFPPDVLESIIVFAKRCYAICYGIINPVKNLRLNGTWLFTRLARLFRLTYIMLMMLMQLDRVTQYPIPPNVVGAGSHRTCCKH